LHSNKKSLEFSFQTNCFMSGKIQKLKPSFMKKIIVIQLFLIAVVVSSCNNQSGENTTKQEVPRSEGQRIVDSSIEFHGLSPLDNAKLDLVFRKKFYTYQKSNGIFQYTRSQVDSIGTTIYDIMNNEGLVRLTNKDINELVTEVGPIIGDTAVITEERRAAFTSSVNSVVYFFLLPHGLNDLAVNKEYLGETTIKGKEYFEIKVTFEQEGGGEDFDDVFLYWFDKEDFSMDYFAYLYHTEGGGMRFREAINPRRISGMLIQDYINFKPEDESIDIMTIDELYEKGELIVLSEIINENVRISH